MKLSQLKAAIRAFKKDTPNARKYDSRTIWAPACDAAGGVISYDAITWANGVLQAISWWGSDLYWDRWDLPPTGPVYTGQLDDRGDPPGWVMDVARAVRGPTRD